MSIIARVGDLLDRSKFPPGVVFVARGAALPTDVDTVVVDLGMAGALDAVRELRAAGFAGRVVGYGRHTERELLADAAAAGCDAVLPRSTFFADVAGALG